MHFSFCILFPFTFFFFLKKNLFYVFIYDYVWLQSAKEKKETQRTWNDNATLFESVGELFE